MPLVPYLLASQADTSNVAYRRRGQGQLTVSSASLPPANCTKLCSSGMADRQAWLACLLEARRAFGPRLGAVRGCLLREAVRAAACRTP
jgi:hypothetical protein